MSDVATAVAFSPPAHALAREIRATAALSLPLVAGQISTMAMGVAEVILAGHLNAHVLGVVAVGSALFNVANLAAAGVNAAVAPSVAQLDGARRRDRTGPLFRQALAIAAALGVLLTALLWFGGPVLARQFGFAPALAEDVGGFLRASAPAAFGLSLFYCARGLSEGLSLPRPTMLFGLLGFVVVAPVGYALMYGAAGLPALGAVGAGLATTVAIAAQTVGFALWLLLSRRYRGIGWRTGRRGADGQAIVALLRVGLPMAVSLLLETTLFSAAGLAIGRFGEVAAAGHQVALNVAAFSFMVPLGISIAATVRVGNAAGRGDTAGVRRAGIAGMGLALAVQMLSGTAMLVAPEVIARIYTQQDDVVSVAVVLLRIAGVFQVSDGLQVSAIGALRGLKDTRVPMLITAVAYWGIGFPLALWLAFGLDWGPQGMWYGLIAALTVAGLLLSARFFARSRRPEPAA